MIKYIPLGSEKFVMAGMRRRCLTTFQKERTRPMSWNCIEKSAGSNSSSRLMRSWGACAAMGARGTCTFTPAAAALEKVLQWSFLAKELVWHHPPSGTRNLAVGHNPQRTRLYVEPPGLHSPWMQTRHDACAPTVAGVQLPALYHRTPESGRPGGTGCD